MNCIICKTGEMDSGRTTVTLDRHGATIVFRNVAAMVCETCGEYMLDEAVTESLLERAERAAREGAGVQVVQHAA